MSEVQGPTIFFDAQIKGLSGIRDQFKREFGEANKIADKLGRELDKATEGMERLRQQVDQTVDPLRMFGKRGIDIANAIDDIADPARRSALAIAHLRAQMNPGPVEKFHRAINNAKAEFELARVQMGALVPVVGAFAAGVTAAGAALAAFIVKGLKSMIEDSASATHQMRLLEAQIDGLAESMAAGASRGAELDKTLAGAGHTVEGLTRAFDTLSAIQSMLPRELVFIADGFNALFNPGSAAVLGIQVLERIGGAMGMMTGTLTGATSAVNNLAESFANAKEQARLFLVTFGAAAEFRGEKIAGGVGKVFGDWAEAGGRAQLKDAEAMIKRVTSRAGGKGGGGSKQDRAKQLQEESAALVGVLANDLDLMMDRARESFGVKFLAPLKAQAQAFVDDDKAGGLAAISANNLAALGKIDAQAMATKSVMDSLAHSVGSTLAGSFLDLAGSVGAAMGAFAAGTGTLSAFGDAILDTFGGLASSLGDFYLKTGLGMLFLNPATGAGLIAAGLGLKALGGFLGGKGSGNRGSGRGSSSSGGASVDPSRFLRPERSMEPSVTNLKVVILGEEIEKPVTRFMDDVARRGGFRNLATRT